MTLTAGRGPRGQAALAPSPELREPSQVPVAATKPAANGKRPLVTVLGTIMFLLPYFLSRIQTGPGGQRINLHTPRIAIYALLVLGAYAVAEGRTQRLIPLLLVVSLLVVTSAPYLYMYDSPPVLSHAEFAGNLATSVQIVLSIFVYAFLLFDERLLLSLFRWFSILTLVVGALAYLANKATGQPYLVSYPQAGGTRLQAFLSEPSALAPLIALGILLGFMRKDWLWFGASLVGLYLTKSPTVYITALLTVGIYAGLRKIWLLGLSATAIAGAFHYLNNADYRTLETDPNPLKQTVGRLASGVVNVTSGGLQGNNVRFGGALNVWDNLTTHGWLYSGYGLNAGSVYFPAIYGDVQDYSLPLVVLFSFGVFGLAAFIALWIWALRRVRPMAYFPVFLAFTAVSIINSAEGFATYQFVLLGIALPFVVPRDRAARPDRLRQSPPATKSAPPPARG